MGSWDFGNTTTLNTAALRAFVDRPDWRCEALARENLTPPCELPCDEISERLIAEQARHADALRAVAPTECLHYFQSCGYVHKLGEML